MKKEEVKVGAKVRDYFLRNMGTAATITELTEKGFKYSVDKPYTIVCGHNGNSNEFAEVFEGEVFEKNLLEWEVVKPIKL